MNEIPNFTGEKLLPPPLLLLLWLRRLLTSFVMILAAMAREQRAGERLEAVGAWASACTAWKHAFPMFVSTAWLLVPGPLRRKPMLEPHWE